MILLELRGSQWRLRQSQSRPPSPLLMHWRGWFWTPRRQRETALFVWKRLTQGVKQSGCRARMSITPIALLSGCKLVTCVLFAAIICPVTTCELCPV
ncbi:hypothetical protein NC652_019622 [Populus alba x Populus x berolinensis]|nr:hypothetical protein NC652_019622 [Populus alba x Populus x berolinensis]